MSFTTQQEATFCHISDTGTCVYRLTQKVDLESETYYNF